MANDHPKVKLAPSTWVAMFSLITTIVIATAALSVFIFETKTSAAKHKGEFTTHVEKASGNIKLNKRSIKEFKRERLEQEQTLENVRDNLLIMMARQGLKRKIKPMEEIADAEIDEIPID